MDMAVDQTREQIGSVQVKLLSSFVGSDTGYDALVNRQAPVAYLVGMDIHNTGILQYKICLSPARGNID